MKLNRFLGKKIQQIQWTVAAAGMVITLVIAGFYVFKPPYMRLMENKLYDVFLSVAHTKKAPSSVAIVDIDEYSISRFGQWPWPRYRVALLLKKIQLAGALCVGNDILFGEPDGTSPLVIKKMLKRDLQVDLGFNGLPAELLDNDQLLANVLGTGPFVLGYSLVFQADGVPVLEVPGLPVLKTSEVRSEGAGQGGGFLIPAFRVIPPLPQLLEKSAHAGFMNTSTDEDGVLRRVPLMISWKGKIYPHLSLATLLVAFKGRVPDPILKVTQGGVESLKIGSTIIPLEANGSMLVNYKGPKHTFSYIPAGHVLEDRVPPGALDKKVVFLGSSAAGLMDIRVSPLDAVFPGVEVNATIVDNILNQDFIRRPDWVPGLELLAIFIWGIVTTILIGWASGWLTLPITAMLGVCAWYGGIFSLKTHHIWISPLFPLLVLGANFSLLTLFKFWFSERKKKFYRSAFSKYVSKAVVDQISDSPEKMSLDGEEKIITIMFADIRSFTSLSERLSPTQVTMLLHDYFTPVTRSIIKNHGTLDKFIGDAVMCFWNAPLDVKNHEALAVKTGFEMLAALVELNRLFIDKYGIQIDIGIGIHSGKCRVGNMGSADLFDYTIIGDNVNLTSRLEGLTKFYGVKLIVSEVMVTKLSLPMQFQELDRVRVKGKNEPVGIYTVHLPTTYEKQSLESELQAYEQGLVAYKTKQFENAHGIFQTLCQKYPRKINQIYLERTAFFIENPPDTDWDGVFTHQTK
ncbi:MAG: adenylate/guanylate cyclase domain-containing protein [Proteobacteria bacterium]|nr:adenylate/guanylate cyclase domain-containing protein [Pseudomonadota bacterium]